MTQPSLPLDLTGAAVGNHVTDELHDLTVTRTVATDYGAFFTESLSIYIDPLEPLQPITDYVVLHLFKDASIASGKEVCTVVHFKDHVADGEYTFDYQAIGGQYSGNVETIRLLIEAQDLNNKPIVWGGILELPEQYTPAAHMHHLGDLYGWEGILTLLDELRKAVLQGDAASFNAVYNYLDRRFEVERGHIDWLFEQINIPTATTEVAGISKFATMQTAEDNTTESVNMDVLTKSMNYRKFDRPIATAVLDTRSSNLKVYEYVVGGGTSASVQTSGYYRFIEEVLSFNNPKLKFSCLPHTHLVQEWVDEPSKPEYGNMVRIQRKSGSQGKAELQGLVVEAGFGPSGLWEFTIVLKENTTAIPAVGERYFPVEYRQRVDFTRGDFLTTAYWNNVVSVQRLGVGQYWVNIKLKALQDFGLNPEDHLSNGFGANPPTAGRLWPVGSAAEAGTDNNPRVVFPWGGNWLDGYGDSIYSPLLDVRQTIYRCCVPVLMKDVNANADLNDSRMCSLQFWYN